jgi:predicted metal-dependent hydrolase
MIKHVVLFKLKPGICWDDPVVRQAEQMAAQVGERVADLVTWHAARNISPRDIAYDFFVEGRLADQAALDRYLAHPFHQKAIRLWRQISDWVIVDVLEGPNVHAV